MGKGRGPEDSDDDAAFEEAQPETDDEYAVDEAELSESDDEAANDDPLSPTKIKQAKMEKARIRELKRQQKAELEKMREQQNAAIAKVCARSDPRVGFFAGATARSASRSRSPRAFFVFSRSPASFFDERSSGRERADPSDARARRARS